MQEEPKGITITQSLFTALEVYVERDIEKIKAIIAEKSKRYQSKMGEVTFAGIEGGTVKIAPSGFCWR
jgi:hypothetical protein